MPIATAQQLVRLMVGFPLFSFFEIRFDVLLAQVAASNQSKSSRTTVQPATETDGQVQGFFLFKKYILYKTMTLSCLALRSSEKNVSSLDKGSCFSWVFVWFVNQIF